MHLQKFCLTFGVHFITRSGFFIGVFILNATILKFISLFICFADICFTHLSSFAERLTGFFVYVFFWALRFNREKSNVHIVCLIAFNTFIMRV